MEAIAKLEDREIEKVLFPTLGAFLPLLAQNKDAIASVPVKTFTYGGTPRHQLDVYYPPNPASGASPVLFFIYGGGFTSGERTLPGPASLAYANLGAYFARKGFIVVVPDYRLVPHVKFPGPAEDIRDAVTWVVDDLNKSSDAGLPQAETNSIFIAGHSAGAAHTCTTVFYPGLAPAELKQHIKGLVLMSGAYHNFPAGTKGDFEDLKDVYWSGEEHMKKNEPLQLLQGVPESEVAKIPSILLVEGEREPEWLQIVGEDFYKEASKRGVHAEKLIAKGHNHISLSMALSSGQGEEWADTAAEWMLARLSS
ncbi:hypothetical protein PLEOSDRAFT_1058708 [Pleurotus ostreatus PC15]|uniref:BD-FAE-like domain-containing protein n=1 Tax=Pleurotus ostreatus (strain PC15) TaxID=1137138 RepID=A0A067NKX8_PLEO1|nr:hypothetical protein PLEOSDRAFT_1058708 [Pleurotus ostreatus PC15]